MAPVAATVAGVLVVAALVTTGFLIDRSRADPASEEGISAPATTAPRTTPAALFVGDSYTQGTGARSPQTGYACLSAAAMGWYCNVDAQGGTGYINDGHNNSPTNQPFAPRLEHDRAFRADIVIVDGGRNDGNHTAAEVVAAAGTYLEQIHAAWPQAPIVVIVPFYLDSTPETYGFGVQFAKGIKPVVERYGGVVIDPLSERWISPAQVKGFRWTDGIHPDVAGHEYIAQRLTAALRAHGFDQLPVTDDRPIGQG